MPTLFRRCCSRFATAKVSLGQPVGCRLRWFGGGPAVYSPPHRASASTSPQVGSIYNMGMWDKAAATWLRVHVHWTLDTEAAACRQYEETGRSLDNGGCIGEPHILVDQYLGLVCIVHYCMAIGRL